ncbi:Hemicentin-1, partial [Biomphalaria glabrata]
TDDDGAVDEDLQGLVGFVTTMSTRFVFTIPGILLAHVNLESALQVSMFTMQGPVVIRLNTHHFGSLNMTVLVTKQKPELISPGQFPTYDRGHKGTYSALGNSTFGLMVSASQTRYSLDIFTAIPVESWDKDYIAVTVGQNPSLVIVADVAVSVTVRMRRDGRHRPIAILHSNRVHVSGSDIVISLRSYQSYEISECNSRDIVATLTGSVLTGSHPFGVVSGSCRSISRGYECEQEHFGESMDFTAEMLMPKSSFGKEFIVVSYNFPEYSGELVVVASVNNTSFQIARDNNGGADAYTLDDPGDWLKLDLTNVTGILLSNRPILVMHYFRVRCAADRFRRSDLGDPSLGLLVPSVLFFHEYTWNVFDNTEDKLSHFALAIFAARYAASLRLNSVKITMNNTRKVMGLPGWVTSSFMLPSTGVYTLESDIFAVFGLYVFGRHKQVTYLTFAGSIMSKINTLCHQTDMLVCDDIDNDCDGRIDEELLWGKDDDLDHRKSEDVCYNPQPKRRPPPDTLSTNMTLSSVP